MAARILTQVQRVEHLISQIEAIEPVDGAPGIQVPAPLSLLLALHHLVALRAADVLPHLEDYAAVAGPAPRNLNLITGASGTTDIEGSLVLGAHGPRFLHVVIVGEVEPAA